MPTALEGQGDLGMNTNIRKSDAQSSWREVKISLSRGFQGRHGCFSYGYQEEGRLEKTVLSEETGREKQAVLCLGDWQKQGSEAQGGRVWLASLVAVCVLGYPSVQA